MTGPMATRRAEFLLPYAAGLALLLTVTVVRVMIGPFVGQTVSLLPFVIPVVLAALLGGFIPAIVLTAVSLATADWFLMHPLYSFAITDSDEVGRALMFIVVGIGIGALGERQHRAVEHLRETSRKLQRSEERSRQILDGLFAFAGLLTPEGILIEANRAALTAAGIKANDVLGKPFVDAYWWSWSPEVQRKLRDAIERAREGEPVRYDTEIRVAGDRRMTIDFMIAPIYDDLGRLAHLVPSAIDITARLEAEAARARSESRLQRFADANLVGFMTAHVEGAITEANDAFLEMIGYSRDDVREGRLEWRALTPPEMLAADQKGIAEAVEHGACLPYEKEFFHKDGYRVPILIGYARVGDDDFIVFVLDLTEQKRAQHQLQAAKEEAEAANAAKDEFLMVVSHELRTPMTSLLGWVQMLLMGHVDPKDVHSAIERIHESAVAEIEIIENILDVARLAVGKFVTRRERVDVSGIAEAALAQLARAVERIITLDGAVSPNALVNGDSDRLRQVINNLLSNAIKFTEPGGRVSLAVSSGEGRVRIEVADDGIGIAPEFLAHVFDRFRQADEARSRRYGGLGLGLAIAKHLVEAHGGSIHAESEGAGRGARFVVELPALEK
ncbi:MAG: ATP-binding protein [Thermoanaerobaculia bacterium]